MALADPQSITVNSVAQSMPRVSTGGQQSIYAKSDKTYSLRISHQPTNKRVRSLARFDHRAIVTDPLNSAVSDYDTVSIQLVIDRPEYGFSVTDVDNDVQGFKAWLTTAIVTALYGQQS